jgi:hypothetical protein
VSGKNALGQEAFGSKVKEMPVEQSPTVSAVDVTSMAVGVGVTAASAVKKAGTGTAPPAEGEQDDLCMANPQLTPDQQTAEVGGARVEDDAHWCLYVDTPWEGEAIADCRDVDEFKEVTHTIGCVLLVRVLV